MKMNDRLLVGLLLIGLLVYGAGAQDPRCDNVYEACYFKTGDEESAVQRGGKIPISQGDFLMGARIVMEQPYEFGENHYGNPFPLISIVFYAKKDKVKRNFYFKIKNAEKNSISRTQGASLLEGNYEYPYLIITVPFNQNDDPDKRAFVVYSGEVQVTKQYWYSNFPKFPMNAYVDLFRNEVLFDFSSVSADSLAQRDEVTAYREDTMFRYNLRPYQRTCAEVRMQGNKSAEAFKKEVIERMEDGEEKTQKKQMKLTDFLRSVDYLKRMASFCGEIRESITSDASCLRANPNKCESFLRLEMLHSNLYQFHLFTRAQISYVILRFLHAKKPTTKLEILCERGKEFLDYTLVVGEKRTPASKYQKELNLNASLIDRKSVV